MEKNLHTNEFINEAIINYLSGELTKDEETRLTAWLKEDKQNVRYLQQLKDIWVESSLINNPNHFDTNEGLIRFLEGVQNSKKSEPVQRSIYSFLKIAALFIALIGLGSIILYSSGYSIINLHNTSADNELVVPLGSKSKLVLPDGSIVWLNAGSTLRYKQNFGVSNRDLFLEGEGFFKVSKNKKIPFIVKTDFLQVKATGTEFNVKAYPNDKNIETLLTEGSVDITLKNTNAATSVINIKPNQRLTYNKDDHSLKINYTGQLTNNYTKYIVITQAQKTIPVAVDYVNTKVDQSIYVTWKDSRWTICREKLGDLAIKLERKYNVNIHFEQETLKSFCFSGTLQDESIEQVLKFISSTAPIDYSINGKEVVFKQNMQKTQKYNDFLQSIK